MAIRNLRFDEDPILRKKCRPIEKIDERIVELARDMVETMYNAEGVGLAAPQVGILKRLVVIDVGDGPINMINPEIVEAEGAICDYEACLSFPNKSARVERPERVVVKYTDLEGLEQTIEGTELLARALCHEIDHLDGIVFLDKIAE